MDHIPLPAGAAAPRVPFLGKLYDNGDFPTYPARQGMRNDLETSNFLSRKPAEYQAFFQAWLYFGCMIEVFKVLELNVDTSKFLKETGLGIEVKSTALHVYIDEWKYRSRSYKSEKMRQGIWSRICSVLSDVRTALDGPVKNFTKFLEKQSEVQLLFWPNISLSIGILGWSLQEAGYQMRYVAPTYWTQYRWGEHAILKERLQQSGWCQAEINRFLREEAPDFLLYTGTVISPRAGDDHSECSGNICVGKAANVYNYKTRHTVDCTGKSCKLWEMPGSSWDIIRDGGTPLACWSHSGLQVLRLDEKTDMVYVAISHVWSDGKGNPDQNSLPECQLRSLQQKLDILYSVPRRGPRQMLNIHGPKNPHKFRDPWRKPVGFWMDTLCVPVGDDQKGLRGHTISQMRRIYEGADRVLVLDDWVEELSVSSSIYQKAVRICLSNWQHRLWTLQEGVLAQQLFIQFRDGQQTLDQIQDENRLSKTDVDSPAFYSRIGVSLAAVPIFNIFLPLDLAKELVPRMHQLFTPLVPAISSRTTTKSEDETICIATLLRLDTRPLQKISKQKRPDRDKMTAEEKVEEEAKICDARMERFLSMVGSFEQRIIFNKLPRLQNDGFRWAPRSFLGQSLPTFVRTADTAHNRKSPPLPAKILTESIPGAEGGLGTGLLVAYPGILLESVTLAQLQGGLFYMSRKNHGSFLYRVSLDILPRDNAKSAWLDGEGQYALVTSGILHNESRGPIPSVLGVLRPRTKSGIRRLRHLCVATVEAVGGGEALAQQSETSTGLWLESENQWCII